MSTPVRVLIVEDSEDDAQLLLRELKRGGYDPLYERVETPDAMWAALAERPWDLILSDYSMPGFSAPAALALLKNSGLDLPFLIVSGTVGEDTAVAALKAGAHDFLVKDNLARFIPAVQRELREAEVRRGHRRAEANYQRLVEQIPAVTYVSVLDELSTTTFVSPQLEATLGFSPSEWIADPRLRIKQLHPEDRERVLEHYARTRADLEPCHVEYRIFARDGREVWVRDDARVVRDDAGRPAFLHGLLFDITEHKRAEEKIQHQLERLSALRQIDRAISASLDLRLTLNVVLEQVTSQLKVDAADVLLLNSHLQTLEYAAGRGFRSKAIEDSRLRLGQGKAGRAALERTLVRLPNLDEEESEFARAALLAEEDFHAYYAVPLLVKGQVKGVLEVFHRVPLNPDDEWLNFLETLAGQAAIAIENALLFDDLQRSNYRLITAYDTTIEGWSRALDLRDKETEGHTLRVTKMTVRLARAMGIKDEELVHIWRGSLLHDIGKMGIPDHILLKPGPLTDEEWTIMRQHPVYAYQLLSPIDYLRPALDIPYCHHEKWDGTGYPRGLKGEGIPLAARLFAVVDVWDALRSDRPYRPAWPKDRVLEHIRSLRGAHFDPQVVDTFLRTIAEESPPD